MDLPPFLLPPSSSAALRHELGRRNLARAAGYEHELTYGESPCVIYQQQNGLHGNFLPASYRSICADPAWRKRLGKSYSAGRRIAHSGERKRYELDCANSSDALLMNIFCHPGVLRRPALCALLGIDPGLRPQFGFKPRIPFTNGRTDTTEIDMSLGHLLVEAKLTETAFQTVPLERVQRYRDLEEVLNVDALPSAGDTVHSYQLIRGVLAAYRCQRSFLVLCDDRRSDLRERWFQIMSAVRDCSLRSRLALLTWQELASTLPRTLRSFLEDKYGIYSESASNG